MMESSKKNGSNLLESYAKFHAEGKQGIVSDRCLRELSQIPTIDYKTIR